MATSRVWSKRTDLEMDQSGISNRAQEKLQGCLGFGGIFLGAGIAVMLAGGPWGIVIAAIGQAVLLVGLVGFAVKLGVEAATHPMIEAPPGD